MIEHAGLCGATGALLSRFATRIGV